MSYEKLSSQMDDCTKSDLIPNVVSFYQSLDSQTPGIIHGMTMNEINSIESKYNIKIRGALRQFICFVGADYSVMFHGSVDSMAHVEDLQDSIAYLAEEYPDTMTFFPSDAFVISNWGHEIIYVRKSELVLNEDPSVYRWSMTKWFTRRDNVSELLSPHFSEYINSLASSLINR